MRSLYSKYSLYIVGFLLLFSKTNAYSQTGLSKTFFYKGDSIIRGDYAFSNFLFDSTDQAYLMPFGSVNQQSRYLGQWRKLDTNGNIISSKVEDIRDTRYNIDIISESYSPSRFFYAAGNFRRFTDTFSTYFIQKLDYNLETKWTKFYPTSVTYGLMVGLIPLNDKELLFVPNFVRGAIDSIYPAQNRRATFTKIDTSGNLIWTKIIDSAESIGFGNAIRAHDDNIILCGSTSGYGITDRGACIIMKIDTAGNKLWHKIYDRPDYDGLAKIIATQDGNYIAVGWTGLNPEIQNMPNSAGRILKIDEDGNVIWDKTLNISPRYEEFRTVIETPQGDIIALGSSAKYYAYDSYNYEVGSTREPEGWAVKLDANGNEIWNSVFGHNEVPFAHDYLYNALPLPDGGFIATGTTQVADTAWSQGVATPYVRQAAWVVKLDSDGCIAPSCPWNLSEYQS